MMDLKFTPGTILSVGEVSVFQHRDRDQWLITVQGQIHPLELTQRQVIDLVHALGATRELEEGAFITQIRKQLRGAGGLDE
jgi:hypothetical protein